MADKSLEIGAFSVEAGARIAPPDNLAVSGPFQRNRVRAQTPNCESTVPRYHTVELHWLGKRFVGILAVTFMLVVGIGLLLIVLARVRQASNLVACENNLRILAIALHGHDDTYGVLPRRRTGAAAGSEVQHLH